MGVSMSEVFNTLQVYLGSLYVNDFNRFGRTWQVNVQADADFRKQIDDLKQLKVRNDRGRMVPLGTLASIRDVSGPVMIMRYNMYPSAAINGNAGPGRQLRARRSRRWTNVGQHGTAPGDAVPSGPSWPCCNCRPATRPCCVFVLAVVLVFLVLAAQYESWSLPLAVILVVPMCLLCSIAGVALARMDINIFTQVGFVVLVGLACKNAILIVEFAKARREAGAAALRGHAGRLPAAAAADHHDLVRLHPRRGAAGDRRRGRGRDAAHAGHGRLQRHARRDALRHLPHAGLLLRDPVGERPPGRRPRASRNEPRPGIQEPFPLSSVGQRPAPQGRQP